jgi:hypothetical protein
MKRYRTTRRRYRSTWSEAYQRWRCVRACCMEWIYACRATLKSEGSFTGLANVASYADINGFLAEDLRAREYRTRAQRAGVL